MTAQHYSFWLVPQEPDLTYYQDLISRLSDRYGTVSFCPHVTLSSGFLPVSVDPVEVCEVFSPVKSVELEVGALGYKSSFSRTLYVHFKSSSQLIDMLDRLLATIPGAMETTLHPHLSLLYHNLDEQSRRTLAESLSLPRASVRFNQVQVVAAPESFETQAHVASLRRVHSRFLSAP